MFGRDAGNNLFNLAPLLPQKGAGELVFRYVLRLITYLGKPFKFGKFEQ